ncbi:MAG: T9SS type A sorting domain-containing protein [Taibaiella sp.]|nr:T9SS type A sorting domain-containing protein [Taibaiella sp.]
MNIRLLHSLAGLFFLFFLVASGEAFGQGGVITTFAGGGTATGSGGPATGAYIVQTGGVTVDAIGNVYFTDTFKTIKKVDAVTGTVTTIAGSMTGGWSGFTGDGGPASAAEITANWLCTDASGNIYLSGVNRVRKIDIVTGIITTVAGNGSYSTSGDGGPATAAGLPFAGAIWVDPSNNVYVCTDNRVRRVDGTTGIISTVAGTGSTTFSGDGGPATAAGLDATGICMTAAGELVITGRTHNRVRMVSVGGIITTIAGTGSSTASGDGGPATAAGLSAPYGIALDGAGNIYLSSYWSTGVRRIDAGTGIISTVIGGTGGASVAGTGALCTTVRPVQLASNVVGSIYGAIDFNTIFKAVVTPAAFSSSIATFNSSTNCASSAFWVTTTAGGPSLSIQTYFGDGTDVIAPMTASICPLTPGYAYFNHNYAVGGTYTVKHVLINAGIRVDSVTFSYNYSLCREAHLSLYLDTNSNCVRDPHEYLNIGSVTVEVDSVGVPVDTVVTLGGLYYDMYGTSGDIYDFKIIAHHPLFTPSCPMSGVVSDTVIGATSSYEKTMGFDCGGTGTDLAVSVGARAAWFRAKAYAWVRNYACDTVSPVVRVDYDPRYLYSSSTSTPISLSAGTASFHLPPISVNSGYASVAISLDTVSALPVGDTINTRGFAGPLTADVDTFNNRDSRTDWVYGAWDPNQISVYPGPCITSAPTELEYTIQFENLGNDTAHNIHVMDTLADELDFSSFRLDFSSVNNVVVKEITSGSLHIVKFDFPGIKLPDSSSHQNTGMFVYKIKTRPGLADGTNIPARVGIYFDVNPVVMTNTVSNIVNCPTTVKVAEVQHAGDVLLYPNPATDILTLQVGEAAFSSVSITNAIGQEMMHVPMTDHKKLLDVKALPTGVYQVILRGHQGSEVRKFVKW